MLVGKVFLTKNIKIAEKLEKIVFFSADYLEYIYVIKVDFVLRHK